MHYVAQRIGLRIPPGIIVVLVILAAVIGAAFWIGPLRPLPPEVQLLASDGTHFRPVAALANAGTAAEPRFPVLLALRNAGRRSAQPAALSLSIPGSYRLRSARYDLVREVEPGNPLVRYTVPVEVGELQPDAPATPLVALDTLWLEPHLDDYYCSTMADSVPEFAPAPRIDPERLADVQAFYSVRDGRVAGRATGMLNLQLEVAALDRPVPPRPPVFPTELREPAVGAPALASLTLAGTRSAPCGDPQQPLELFTSTWETPAGGRLLVVYVNGAPRKHLYDLDRDSIIELELWDPDNDGRFEARRAARYPIPEFLLPERLPEAVLAHDSAAADPAWQLLFHDTAAGPYRFVADSLAPPSLRTLASADTLAPVADSLPPARALPPARVPGAAPDTAWLRRFNDTEAGPYRFATDPPPRLYRPPPPAPRPRRNEPLGTPVPYPPPD
jgi:hypothetical protein